MWTNPKKTATFFTFYKEILNGKLQIFVLCIYEKITTNDKISRLGKCSCNVNEKGIYPISAQCCIPCSKYIANQMTGFYMEHNTGSCLFYFQLALFHDSQIRFSRDSS